MKKTPNQQNYAGIIKHTPDSLKNIGNLTQDHFLAFNAIDLWHRILENITYKSRDDDYIRLVSNANAITNPNMEKDINKVIRDFYDYFYTHQHVADFNHNDYALFTNDYARLADIVTKGERKETNMLREVTFYTFDLLISLRESLKLPIFETKLHDERIVKYYTRYDDKRYYGENKTNE